MNDRICVPSFRKRAASLLFVLAIAMILPPAAQARWTTLSAPESPAPAWVETGRRLDVFARGTDGTLQHRWTAYGSGTWTQWESLGGLVDSAPAAVASDRGYMFVFFRTGDDLWMYTLNVCCYQTSIVSQKNLGHLPSWVAGPWDCFVRQECGFHSQGGLTSAPAATRSNSGRIDVFAFSGEHWLTHRSFEPYITNAIYDDGWSEWEILSDADFAEDPAAVSWGDGRIDVLVHGSDDNQLYDKVYDGGWYNWLGLGGTLTSGPTAGTWAPGHMVIFARNQFSGLSARGYWGDTWFGWSTLDGSFIGAPSVTTWGLDTWSVFALSDHNTLLHQWYISGVWSGWEDLGGAINSAPAAVVVSY